MNMYKTWESHRWNIKGEGEKNFRPPILPLRGSWDPKFLYTLWPLCALMTVTYNQPWPEGMQKGRHINKFSAFFGTDGVSWGLGKLS